jgi:lipopolysaccharide export system permease protein
MFILAPRRIDRYIFFLFARVFVLCFVCLTGIYVIGDFVNNLNEFIDYAHVNGGMLRLIGWYYGARTPLFFDLVGRVTALIAAVFAMTWLQRHNEMTALMAAGISRWRIIKPILWGVVAVSVLGAVNREFVLPRYKDQLSRKARDLGGVRDQPIQPRYDQRTDVLISGDSINAQEMRINNPRFFLPLDLASFGGQIAANTAIRKPAAPEHPAGYHLVGVTTPQTIDQLASVIVNNYPVIMTARDYAWLGPDECFVSSDVSLTQLTENRAWSQCSSTKSLIRAMRNPSLDLGNIVAVTIHGRLVQPVLDIVLFFLGVPTVLARESRNAFVAIGSCMLVIVVYFLIVLGCQGMGKNYLISPALAAWIPLIVMVPWATFVWGPFRG